MTESTNDPTVISSSRVNVSNLIFSNLSRNNTPGLVSIQFDISHVNPGNRNEFSFEKTFYGSASLR